MDGEEALRIVAMVAPALSGLLGVVVGAWLTGRHQKAERRHAWLRRQLNEFYAPMLGMRQLILAKSESRVKVSSAAGVAWPKLVSGYGPEEQRQIEGEQSPQFKKIIEYDNERLFGEILPLYRKMIEHFSNHMGLAERSTREHFGALVHFVEIWDRSEKNALPAAVSEELGHSEAVLHPFYDDLAANVDRLVRELKG